jgi:hypothetical protein
VARKPITEQTQTDIFLKSRRRCCLCFWHNGEDEVKRGQIAHLDWDNENNAESNLVFLCLDHHDQYDSTPSQSKGLRLREVTRWREELYREMEYRFKSMKRRSAELSAAELIWLSKGKWLKVRVRLRNTGEVELIRVHAAIRLTDGIVVDCSNPPDTFSAYEKREDLFEPNGRVCIKPFTPIASLPPGHSKDFDALQLETDKAKLGSVVDLDYRIDANEMPTQIGTFQFTIPSVIATHDVAG